MEEGEEEEFYEDPMEAYTSLKLEIRLEEGQSHVESGYETIALDSRPLDVGAPEEPALASGWTLVPSTSPPAGVLYVWGRGGDGQLGRAMSGDAHLPQTIPTVRGAAQLVATGGRHSLVRMRNGDVLGFGWNSMGALGQGGPSDCTEPQLNRFFLMLALLARKPVRQVAAGGDHSLVLLADGSLYAFGDDSDGQLGLGPGGGGRQLSPHLVVPLARKHVVQVSCGGAHSVALTSMRTLYAWGKNASGRLGLGHCVSSPVPRKIAALARVQVQSVSCGWSHTLAVTTAGRLFAWGCGLDGRLGLGDTLDRHAPCAVRTLDGVVVRAASAGFYHSACVSAGGRVFTWGWGEHGALGLGMGSSATQWVPRRVTGALTRRFVVEVACGGFHTLFRDRSGALWACGMGLYGQLGLGEDARECTREPRRVEALAGRMACAIGAGWWHSVALVRADDETPRFRDEEPGRAGMLGQLAEDAAWSRDPDRPGRSAARAVRGLRLELELDCLCDAFLTPATQDRDLEAHELASRVLLPDTELPSSDGFAVASSPEGSLDGSSSSTTALSFSSSSSSSSSSLPPSHASASILEDLEKKEMGPFKYRVHSKRNFVHKSSEKSLQPWNGGRTSGGGGTSPTKNSATLGSTPPATASPDSSSSSWSPLLDSRSSEPILERMSRWMDLIAPERTLFVTGKNHAAFLERNRARLEETEVAGRWRSEILPQLRRGGPMAAYRDAWRRGVPPSVRAEVWRIVGGNRYDITREMYAMMCEELERKKLAAPGQMGEENFRDLILLDIHRTFSELGLFQEGRPFHDVMVRLLDSFSIFRPDVGYCQGMSYLAAMLLCNLEEFDAFVVLVSLAVTPLMKGLFKVNVLVVGKLSTAMQMMMERNLPALGAHMRRLAVTTETFLIEWFYTLFCRSLAFDIAMRVWDCFLFEGFACLFVVATAILKCLAPRLLAADAGDMYQILMDLPSHIPADSLFDAMDSVRIPPKVIEFLASGDDEDEIILV